MGDVKRSGNDLWLDLSPGPQVYGVTIDDPLQSVSVGMMP